MRRPSVLPGVLCCFFLEAALTASLAAVPLGGSSFEKRLQSPPDTLWLVKFHCDGADPGCIEISEAFDGLVQRAEGLEIDDMVSFGTVNGDIHSDLASLHGVQAPISEPSLLLFYNGSRVETDVDLNTADASGLARHVVTYHTCLLYTSPSPRDRTRSRMPSSA
eukprot:TRINITY_DN38204_c0_g1_i2.p1 TRINITY_DN38204_c0_g1~~TRINITY_DN38204_c0_g1_i2.p1  ORF type:complete len:164 (-),score=31.02 TRINITY_DN38204_c0_g1_i2:25-516(-)